MYSIGKEMIRMGKLDGFEVWEVSTGVPYVTIGKLGLLFNKAAVERLSRPEHVLLYIDKSTCRIAIAPCRADAKGARAFCKPGRDVRQGIRWNNYDLRTTIASMTGLDLDGGNWKASGAYSEADDALIFDLSAAEPVRARGKSK